MTGSGTIREASRELSREIAAEFEQNRTALNALIATAEATGRTKERTEIIATLRQWALESHESQLAVALADAADRIAAGHFSRKPQ